MSDDSHLSKRDKRIKRLLANTSAPESRSVIEAMRNLEAEVKHQYHPDQWGGKYTPFEILPVTLAKLSKEEIMIKLRARLNRGYMPTSTRPDPSYNSKPQYLDGFSFGNTHDYSDAAFPEFPARHHFDSFGCISWEDKKKKTMYAYYGTRNMEFLANLETEQTLVRTKTGSDNNWYNWDSPEFKGEEISVNPYELDECIDTYL